MNGNEKIPNLTAEEVDNAGKAIHQVGGSETDPQAEFVSIFKPSDRNRQQRRAAERAQNRARRAALAGRHASRELIATVTLTDEPMVDDAADKNIAPTVWLEEN